MLPEGTYRINHHTSATSTNFEVRKGKCKSEASPKLKILSPDHLLWELQQINFPFNAVPDKIIGWGGFSVAVRFRSPEGEDKDFIGVLSLNPTTPNHVSSEWKRDRQLSHKVAEYMPSQQMIILRGINGEPTSLKMSHELDGATLLDLGALQTLGNPDALRQFSAFCKRVTTIFFQDGILADTWGHNNHLLTFFPLASSNILTTYGSNSLMYVDAGYNAEFNDLAKVSFRQKLKLLRRVSLVYTSAVFADAIQTAHRVKQRFSRAEFSDDIEGITQKDEYEGFVAGINEVISLLEGHDIDYRVVGSVALAGHLQSTGERFYIQPRQRGNQQRDIDILIFETEPEKLAKIKELQETFKACHDNNIGFPRVSLATVESGASEDQAMDTSGPIASRHTWLSSKDGQFGNAYQGLFIPFDGAELEPQTQSYDGVQFKTFDPNMIAALYLIRRGAFKLKDLYKISLLFEKTGCTISKRYTDFAQQIRQQYPHDYTHAQIHEWLNYLGLDRPYHIGVNIRNRLKRRNVQ